jgi:NADH dehydrogenase FAD-containing subunit
MKMTQKTILILGGSYAGISTAHYLLKHAIPHLPDKASYQVIIVSTSSQAMCRPACPRAMISDEMFNQDRLFVGIENLFKEYPEGSFHFNNGTATDLDHEKREVSIRSPNGDTETLNFHALIVATGASTQSPLLGLTQTQDQLRASWSIFRKALPSAKSIIIAGGGPAGIETAGELGDYLNGRAGWFNPRPMNPNVSITIVTSSSRILPALRPAQAKKAEEYLAKVGVTIIKDARVKTVEPHGAGTTDVAASATLTLEDGQMLNADLYIPATGTKPNTSFISPTFLMPDNRINTSPSTLRVSAAGPLIYAIGDCASSFRPAIHLILAAIPVLCANIKRDLLLATGEPEKAIGADRNFVEDTRETQLVPIGRSRGVGAAMGWQVPSWMVWAIKGRDYWLWTTGGLWSGKQWAKES